MAEPTIGQSESVPVNGVAETVLSGFDFAELEQYQAQLAESRTSEPPAEKKQEQAK